MSSVDYVALGETSSIWLKPLRATAGVVGLTLVGLAGWLRQHSGASLITLPDATLPTPITPTQPFLPIEGLTSVLVKPVQDETNGNGVALKPGPVGLAQVLPTPSSANCIFNYGTQTRSAANQPSFLKGSTARPGWVYGAKLSPDSSYALLTGQPGDVVKGSLLCWTAATIRGKIHVADAFMGYHHSQPNMGIGRGEVKVVGENGASSQAVWYYQANPMVGSAAGGANPKRKQVWLLDYGAGNVRSLRNAVHSLGYEMKTVERPADIKAAEVLVFPGVGNFGEAMKVLRNRDYVDALKWYVLESGRPFLGICVGMQVLFESSEESPGAAGLGVVPGPITKFPTDRGASVPQIGWNEYAGTKHFLERSVLWNSTRGVRSRDRAYFVHSFRAELTDAVAPWVLATTDYAGDRFVAAIQKGNVVATQFHPEKSGAVGVALLGAFLDAATAGVPLESGTGSVGPVTAALLRSQTTPTHIARRVVACLDVRSNDAGDLIVTKGDSYDVREEHSGEGEAASDGDGYTNTGAVRNLGKPVELAARYYQEGADEITFLNICAFRSEPLGDLPLLSVLQAASHTVFVPLTIGGGIRSYTDSDGASVSALDVAAAYFRAGADKVSIGSDAVAAAEAWYLDGGKDSGKHDKPLAGQIGSANPSAIADISERYGAQAVVVSVDPRRVWLPKGETSAAGPYGPYTIVAPKEARGPNGETHCWYQCTIKGGREGRPLDAVQLGRAVEALGAGEILLNCIDCDGKNNGFDLGLISAVHSAVSIPVIASSGAGSAQHFVEVFQGTEAEAALAAGIFHRREVPISDVKAAMGQAGLPVRDHA
eukprot:gb/GEZN01002034.1/.p1 GENE.gb/GEZN01002034.1/~~gb/GEZN01002034.1/.p1  ORF type:complete len:825 (+),score=66.21 gb/GEZN01002034.1/:34-2508(+)